MAHKITLTGTPTSALRSVGDIFNFDMTQSTNNVPKGLPMPENSIVYTVFINKKQKDKLSVSKQEFPTLKLLVQGEPTLDVPVTDCPGEIGVLCKQIERIPSKDQQQEDKSSSNPEIQEKEKVADSEQIPEKENVALTKKKQKKKKVNVSQETQQEEKVSSNKKIQEENKEVDMAITYPFMDISQIEIPIWLKKTTPSTSKIIKKKEAIQNAGQFIKPLVVSKQHILLDGYATYLAALELGIHEVPIRYKEKEKEKTESLSSVEQAG